MCNGCSCFFASVISLSFKSTAHQGLIEQLFSHHVVMVVMQRDAVSFAYRASGSKYRKHPGRRLLAPPYAWRQRARRHGNARRCTVMHGRGDAHAAGVPPRVPRSAEVRHRGTAAAVEMPGQYGFGEQAPRPEAHGTTSPAGFWARRRW